MRVKDKRLLWLVPAIAIVPIGFVTYLDNRDRPCGRVQNLYFGSTSSYETYQITVDGKVYEVDRDTWENLNQGDLYCEK